MLAKLYDNSGNGLGLKNWLEIADTDTQFDALLTGLLMGVSSRFENDCHRGLTRQEAIVEILDGGRPSICLFRYPIESVTEVVQSRTQDWDNGDVMTEPLSYTTDKKSGILHRYPLRWLPWKQSIRVTYTGGFVLPGDTVGEGQIALPEDIQFAVLEQCRYLWLRRKELGMESVGMGSGTWTLANKDPWLPSVASVIRRYYGYR